MLPAGARCRGSICCLQVCSESRFESHAQDLFTDPAARGKGVGTRLIKAVVAWCQANGGIKKVYWNTHESNPARKMYDAIGKHKGFVKYELAV